VTGPTLPLLPAGTYGNGTGLTVITQCTDVQPGFYAPAGSFLPILCPGWGFCAGRAHDTENSVPGSQPVGVQDGQQVVESTQTVEEAQSVVEQMFELTANNRSEVNETAFLFHMASAYGVPLEAISLELTKEEQALKEWEDAIEEEGEQRRHLRERNAQSNEHSRSLQASSTTFSYRVRINPAFLSSSSSAINVTTIATSLQATAVGLSSSLALVLGVSVSQTALPTAAVLRVNRTVQIFVTADCPPGYWGNGNLCLPCNPGSYDLGGKTANCTDCAGGTFQPERAATSCQQCVAGAVCRPAASATELCVGGRYSNATDLMSGEQCAHCPAGHSCFMGSTVPTSCAPGTTAAILGASRCDSCGGGSYQSASGGTACQICALGSFCTLGASAAQPCPSGRYGSASDLSASDQCTRCPRGSACATGSTAPLPCAAGSFQTEDGHSSCLYCSPGMFQSSTGKTQCSTCEGGTYSKINGSAECNNCLSRTSSRSGSSSCDTCDRGFLRRDAFTRATPMNCEDQLCLETDKVDCPKDTLLETVVVLPGHWRLSNRSRVITKCEGGNATRRCKGGRDAGTAGEGYCGELYTGPE
jgi:hypothetical protein